MRTPFTIILFLSVLHVRADLVETYSSSSYAEYRKFEFQVTREQLSKAPLWRLRDDSPPLAARKAEMAATAEFHKLLKDTTRWRQDSINLKDMGDGIHWIYIVEFSSGYDVENIPAGFRVIILMDGTVVEPKVTDLVQFK